MGKGPSQCNTGLTRRPSWGTEGTDGPGKDEEEDEFTSRGRDVGPGFTAVCAALEAMTGSFKRWFLLTLWTLEIQDQIHCRVGT